MMKNLKLLCPVTGIIHVSFLHMLVPIHSDYKDDCITQFMHTFRVAQRNIHVLPPFSDMQWEVRSFISHYRKKIPAFESQFQSVPPLTLCFCLRRMAMPQIQTKT